MSVRVLMLLALTALAAVPAQARRNGPRKKKLLIVFKEDSSRAEREQAAKDLGLTLTEDFDGLAVGLYEAAGDAGAAELGKARKLKKVVQVQEDVFRNWLVEATPRFAPLPALGAFGRFKPAEAPAPAEGEALTWGLARLNAPKAWERGQGAGVRVAVIDTGVDCAHPDLKCDPASGFNAVEPEKPPFDDNEHGTHVAGTIAARRDGKGVVGVAPKAVIVPVKVLDKDGAGSLSDIIRGINWAVKAKVQVINMSLGGDESVPALERSINKALAAGVVVVAAAGNSGPGEGTVGFPGAYPGVIAVAASDEKDRVAEFSSRGPAVALIAPGVDVLSTTPGGGYQRFSGTSMACPHAAGLAALAIERGAKGPAGVRAALLKTAVKLCPASACAGPQEQGAGLPDAAKL